MQYQRFNRSELRAWDSTMWGIIADAQAEGWLFTVSSKGHALGRSPDGAATMSVPKTDNRRGGKNARAELDRWRVRQERTPSDQRKIDEAVKGMVDPLAGFSDEEIQETIASLLEGFRAANSTADDLGDGALVVLRNALSERANLSKLMTYLQVYKRAPEVLMLDIDADDLTVSPTTRAWRVGWVMFDSVDHHVLLCGGPNMDLDVAEQVVAQIVARRVREKDRTCPTCGKKFDDLRARTAHERTAHAPAVMCEHCGKSYVGIARHRSSCAARVQREIAAAAEVNGGPGETPSPTGAASTAAAGGTTSPREAGARPDAVEAIMDLLAEVEDLRALVRAQSAENLAALTEENERLRLRVHDLTEQSARQESDLAAAMKQAEESERLYTEQAATVARMREALGVRV